MIAPAFRRIMAAGAVTLLGAAPIAVAGAEAGPRPPESRPVMAVILFLSYPREGRPDFDAAALHAGSWNQLAALVRERGHGAIERAEMERFVRRWGVRTSFLVSDGFLKEIADSLQAEELLAADLMIFPDRILLCARSVRTDSDRVVWADAVEIAVPSNEVGAPDSTAGPDAWLEASRTASRRLLELRGSDGARSDASSHLHLVPVRTEGMEEDTGRLATYCLLRALLQSPFGAIEDPGVTYSRLREAGVDPGQIDSRARAALASPGGGRIIVGDLISYGIPEATTGTPVPEVEVEEGETHGLAVTPLPDIAMSLRFIDTDSGAVTFGGTEYLELPPVSGLFGVMKNVSVVRRVQPAADRLVHAAFRKG